ncbi:MAG: hypothetical protein WC365_01000 [Candidatus Babeliales bacterium]|jgi:hypothetical protein
MKQFKEKGKGYKTVIDGKKLIIEIPISTLICAFNYMPDNADGTVIKRGKRQAFAELVAEHLRDEIDSETGASFVTDMFDKLFVAFNDGYIDTSGVIKYAEDE